MNANLKWKFAIGTTSIVPKTHRTLHYLICDIDERDAGATLDFIMSNLPLASKHTNNPIEIRTQQTERGWHIYTNSIFEWKSLLWCLRHIPGVDRNWIRIGARRGYFFLADKDVITFSWPVKRMVIYHEKRKPI
jgi:hypothetical protein